MRLLNEQYKEILESEVDLALGEVVEMTIIKEDATPIDDITKFAWCDEDYEVVKIYRKFTEEELARIEASKAPSPAERIASLEEDNAVLKEENAMLMECILEMSEIIYA